MWPRTSQRIFVRDGRDRTLGLRASTVLISSRETPCCSRESDHTDCKKSFEPSTTTSISCLRDSSSTLCRQEHLTRDFSHAPCTCDHTHIVAQGVSVRISLHPQAIHDVTCFERAFVVSSCLSLSCFSPTSTFSPSQSTCSLSRTPSSMSSPPRVKTTALTHNEKYCPMAIYHPLTPRDQPEPDLITEEIDCKSLPSAHKPGSSFDPRTCRSHTCHWW